MLDLEARARQLVVQLETKETAHLERVHQALLAPLGVGDVVDELDALDLIEPVSRHDSVGAPHPTAVRQGELGLFAEPSACGEMAMNRGEAGKLVLTTVRRC